MRRQRGHRQVLGGAFVGLLLFSTPAAVCEVQVPAGADCVLSSMELITEDSKARLVLLTNDPPASLGTKIEPNEGMVLDLTGCVADPELAGSRFEDGLVASLQLVNDDLALAVIIETRQSFEYSVSSKLDRVEVTLRPAAPTQTLVRVLEPLPLPSAPDPSQTPQETLQPLAVVPVQPLEATISEPTVSESTIAAQIVDAARVSIERAPVYDSAYTILSYPSGDPGRERGSGVDLIVRAYRELGIDLQQQIHEDIRASGVAYGIRRPDPHIDHRRVRNLVIFFSRHGQNLGLDKNADWRAGDIVLWARDKSQADQVGIVSDTLGPSGHLMVIHHSQGSVPKEQDVLHAWSIAHHFRWLPSSLSRTPNPD